VCVCGWGSGEAIVLLLLSQGSKIITCKNTTDKNTADKNIADKNTANKNTRTQPIRTQPIRTQEHSQQEHSSSIVCGGISHVFILLLCFKSHNFTSPVSTEITTHLTLSEMADKGYYCSKTNWAEAICSKKTNQAHSLI